MIKSIPFSVHRSVVAPASSNSKQKHDNKYENCDLKSFFPISSSPPPSKALFHVQSETFSSHVSAVNEVTTERINSLLGQQQWQESVVKLDFADRYSFWYLFLNFPNGLQANFFVRQHTTSNIQKNNTAGFVSRNISSAFQDSFRARTLM